MTNPPPTMSLSGHPLPEYDEPIRDPVGTTPERRAGSIRRTTSMDVVWPEGRDGGSLVIGKGRDALTLADFSLVPLGNAAMRSILDGRTVTEISLSDCALDTAQLAGIDAGGGLRKAFDQLFPDERRRGSLCHLLVDDLAGTSLVSKWTPNYWKSLADPSSIPDGPGRKMEGVCIGFRPGSAALLPGGARRQSPNVVRLPPLIHADDRAGWHELPMATGMHFRRVRRVDIWRDGDAFIVDCHFQDSSSAPDAGKRMGIHEYGTRVVAEADGIIRSIAVTPGTLPYAACRAAPVNMDILLGTQLARLRTSVMTHLKGTAGCTHLNDVMRSLADVPALARRLP
ncbi:DUF2889 domain-containing protein [Croceicoccus sp. YJ47]|uniref:DUF2889 domain-containing protein n=1 Tax=Croceicoccus sp. YJ47 TaxID=2798724 RepID=UPI001920FC47|nr:DUF2889 domain-containing protein [Croceicoccus sp. YJ47]QQN75259.1 DUF2889 domain-containing protein [Croceicoccus sp. YJ47]